MTDRVRIYSALGSEGPRPRGCMWGGASGWRVGDCAAIAQDTEHAAAASLVLSSSHKATNITAGTALGTSFNTSHLPEFHLQVCTVNFQHMNTCSDQTLLAGGSAHILKCPFSKGLGMGMERALGDDVTCPGSHLEARSREGLGLPTQSPS